jgi:hypothetical protein
MTHSRKSLVKMLYVLIMQMSDRKLNILSDKLEGNLEKGKSLLLF